MIMFPIRCLVETVDDGQCPQCSSASGTVIADSYAIVAGQTPLNQLVDTVMAALGLQHLAYGSKATLQLKNWKPLTFDQITDEQDVEIETILKDVSNHLTLRIVTKQNDNVMHGNMNDIKDRLLRAILQKMPNLLSDIQLPYVKEFISHLAHAEQQQHSQSSAIDSSDTVAASLGISLDEWTRKKMALIADGNDAASSTTMGIGNGPGNSMTSAAAANSSGAANAITRFSPLLEVPKLERWFRENANPSRQKLFHYMHLLNASNFRKHTAKITYQQICNWFSNARATNRRRQSRSGGGGQMVRNASGTNGNAGGSTAAAHQHHPNPWSNKVFGSQVRGLSIAFNDFIQSPAGQGSAGMVTNGGMAQYMAAAVTTTNSNSASSPKPLITTNSTAGHGHVISGRTSAHALAPLVSSDEEEDGGGRGGGARSSSSVSSGLVDLKMDCDQSESIGGALPVDNGAGVEITVNGGGGHDRSVSAPSSPTLAAISAVINSAYVNSLAANHASSMANRFNQSANSLINLSQSFAAAGSTPMTSLSTNSASASTNQLQPSSSSSPLNNTAGSNPANRSRLMFDPLTELPLLEKWFEDNPHPSWVQIDQITDNLNMMAYRQTYPKVSSHNVKIWFKNRRAKCKRQVITTDATAIPVTIDHQQQQQHQKILMTSLINSSSNNSKKFDEQQLQQRLQQSSNSFLAE